jgi:hypothetical protein
MSKINKFVGRWPIQGKFILCHNRSEDITLIAEGEEIEGN